MSVHTRALAPRPLGQETTDPCGKSPGGFGRPYSFSLEEL
jgi:hypothetical protein